MSAALSTKFATMWVYELPSNYVPTTPSYNTETLCENQSTHMRYHLKAHIALFSYDAYFKGIYSVWLYNDSQCDAEGEKNVKNLNVRTDVLLRLATRIYRELLILEVSSSHVHQWGGSLVTGWALLSNGCSKISTVKNNLLEVYTWHEMSGWVGVI